MKNLRSMMHLVAAVLFILMISGGEAAAQTAEPSVPAAAAADGPPAVSTPGVMLNTANKLRLQLEGYLGFGLDSITVGKTTNGDDVKISGGGGFGYGATIGYGFSRSIDIDGTFGFQASGLYPAVQNADGYFARTFLLATMKYKIPFRENIQWKFGLGAGYYMGGKLDIDIDPGVPGAGHTVVEYKDSAGFHATGEMEIALQRNLVLAVGLKYYKVAYTADMATFNGVSRPVSLLKDEFRDLNGDGVDITAGLGVLF